MVAVNILAVNFCVQDSFNIIGCIMYYFIDSRNYIRYLHMDCTQGNDFYTLQSNEYPNYDRCKTWWNANINCKAFTVNIYTNLCYFKDQECQREHLFGLEYAATFIPGKIKETKP